MKQVDQAVCEGEGIKIVGRQEDLSLRKKIQSAHVPEKFTYAYR